MANKRSVTSNHDSQLYEELDLPKLPEYEKSHAMLSQQAGRERVESAQTATAKQMKNLKLVVGAMVVFLIAAVLITIILLITSILASVQVHLLKETQAEVQCPELQAPGNGSMAITPGEYSELGLGAIANYSCDSGFFLSGGKIRGCKFSSGGTDTTGMWNGTEPTCHAQCRNLEQLEHGSVVLSQTSSIRQLATYTCDTGYVLVGPNSRECVYSSSEQQWDWSRASSVTPSCAVGIMLDCKEIDCRLIPIRCLDQQGYCRISCNDSSRHPCHQASIECPSSGGGCVVDCTSDQQYACLNTTTRCPESSDCLVNCMSDYSCQYSDVICSNNCSIDCSGRYACANAITHCPENSDCLVNCFGDYSCQYSDVICSNDCNIDCSGRYACQYGNFTCLEGGNCTAKCEDYRSCRRAIMSSENMALACTGSRSCEDATLTGLNHINCSGSFSCYRGRISCLYQGNYLSCHGDYSCQSAMISYSSSTEANLECTGRYACNSMTLNCPTDETCNVDCTGEYSCQYLVINCPQNGDCNVKCESQNGCSNLRVNCPSGGYNCNIKCTDPLSSCGNLRITNTNNVNLQCCGDLSCSGVNVPPTSTTQCQYK